MAVLTECIAHFPPLRLHHPLQRQSNYFGDVVKLLEHYLAAHLDKNVPIILVVDGTTTTFSTLVKKPN